MRETAKKILATAAHSSQRALIVEDFIDEHMESHDPNAFYPDGIVQLKDSLKATNDYEDCVYFVQSVIELANEYAEEDTKK